MDVITNKEIMNCSGLQAGDKIREQHNPALRRVIKNCLYFRKGFNPLKIELWNERKSL